MVFSGTVSVRAADCYLDWRNGATMSRFSKATMWMVLLVLLAVSAVPVAAQIGGRAARPEVDLPGGPVRNVILKNCTSCHGIDDYAFSALDRAGWQKLIETKHKDGGAAISEEDRNLLLDWLVSKFGPSSKPFPRSYIAPAITQFLSDPEARRLLDRSCTSCHALDRVDLARYPETQWRVKLVDMRERGAKVTDEELERLVEWLGRVRGTNQDK
jgi:cytochrome c5